MEIIRRLAFCQTSWRSKARNIWSTSFWNS